jgi:hypothetical protein
MLSPWTHARADVRINGDDDTTRITVEATDSTVLEIAIALGQRFGFQVEATVANPSPIKISGRWNGTVSYILERILRDQNHVIIRTTSQSRIDRVVLIRTSTSTTRSAEVFLRPAEATASLSSPDPMASRSAESEPRGTNKKNEKNVGPSAAVSTAYPLNIPGLKPLDERLASSSANFSSQPPLTTPRSPTELANHFSADISAIASLAGHGLTDMVKGFDSICQQSRSFCSK